jgi:superfamily I DNA and RNA helicase
MLGAQTLRKIKLFYTAFTNTLVNKTKNIYISRTKTPQNTITFTFDTKTLPKIIRHKF